MGSARCYNITAFLFFEAFSAIELTSELLTSHDFPLIQTEINFVPACFSEYNAMFLRIQCNVSQNTMQCFSEYNAMFLRIQCNVSQNTLQLIV